MDPKKAEKKPEANEASADRDFYKIGEVCEMTDTQPYVLRFWESEFPQLAPRKNRSGQRVYQRKDIDLILKIRTLLYEEEYTIAGARKKLDEDGAASGPSPASNTKAGSAASKSASRTDRRLLATLRKIRQELRSVRDLLARRP